MPASRFGGPEGDIDMASVTAQRNTLPATHGWRRAALLAALVLAVVPAALATDTACDENYPLRDGGNYLCKTQLVTLVPNIAATGTAITSWLPTKPAACNGDDCYKLVNFTGGKTFSWYGVAYSRVYVSTNGYVTFAKGYQDPASLIGVPDSGTPNNAIYAFGADLADGTAVGTGTVYYEQRACNAPGRGGDTCFVVQWDDVAILDPIDGTWDAASTAKVGLALDFNTGEAFVQIFDKTDLNVNPSPNVIGTENGLGTAGQWYTGGNNTPGDSTQVNTGFAVMFWLADVTPPTNNTKVTVTADDITGTVEFKKSTSSDYAGTLVVRNTNAPVDGTPVSGTIYNTLDPLGDTSVVACITANNSATACADDTVQLNTQYYYRAYAFDTSHNYAPGVELTSEPKNIANFKWNFNAAVTALNPPGVYSSSSAPYPTLGVVVVGNNRLLHNLNQDTGLRGSWDSPVVNSPVQTRPMVGDVQPEGPPHYKAFLSAQNGYLYQFDLVTGNQDAARNAVGDAGCSGNLQGGAVVMLDAYDSNSTAGDNGLIVATRCGLTNNKILIYDRFLTGLQDSFPKALAGDTATVGITNATPLIIYADKSVGDTDLNLVAVPTRADGTASLYVLQVNGSGTFNHPAYAMVGGIGGIDASPALVRRGTERHIAVGTLGGGVYVYNAFAPSGGSLTLTDQVGTLSKLPAAGTDGAVKGLASSNGINPGSGYFNWVVWTTDTKIHGIKLTPTGFDTATYWEHALGAPSVPQVFTGIITGAPTFTAWVGNNDGRLYRFDATNGSYITYVVKNGATVGEPTFDYNNSAGQGMIVGTSQGTVHWVRIGN